MRSSAWSLSRVARIVCALGIGLYIAAMLICIANADWRFAGLFALIGRTAALLCGRIFPYARESGTGRGFMAGVRWGHIVLAAAIYVALAALLSIDFSAAVFLPKRFVVLCVPFGAALTVTWLVARGISRKLNGITGDVIGFAIELSQVVYLLCGCLLLRLW